ncbi:hypothetical protein D1AOALGA4SA_9003 [Olavius algarvensis Delta 1 endosymbiont]|nr:hypothetical protein D1AOALGA4SA_9003 [Olavius algarvensis Delta 1 endosymbiont]
MFAQDFANKIFSPPRHKGTKSNKQYLFSLCLGAFVANLSGLSGLGIKGLGD